KMLRTIMLLVQDAGYRVGNVDCTVVTDTPKLAPHVLAIRRSLAKPLGVTDKEVSVKATRTEKVIWSSNEGLLAMAAVLVCQ
ncbi:MAG TPA: 2-C-methyl-D-erythritol 2,4-cyclodiphosphate synthase, partial [bacterium]|nr:2-C-methyl-D-erythritol 2,4-cyclodiphosphate synthase [bacterium]